jgi:DNA (cytosine-5)-methyltransferase 1
VPDASSSSHFKIVDLFAGPGGLDSAARDLGVPSVGIEWDDNACATRIAEGLETWQKDVRDLGPEDFGDANVLAGGPPCQSFSVAGNGAGRQALDQVLGFGRRLAAREPLAVIRQELEALSDDRTGLVLEPLRWVLQALDHGRPYEAVILEQVPAVLPVWQEFGRILRECGYIVPEPAVLHAEQYGVPQTRRRAILIARWGAAKASEDVGLQMPTPTHRRYTRVVEQDDNRRLPLMPMGDDILPCVTMGEALKKHRRGQFVVISNYGTGGDPKARGRRNSTEPSATVTGKIRRNRIIDFQGFELRRFSENEAGLLQTFRDGYKWRGGDFYQQIGNAIPPRLGMHVIAAALSLPHQQLTEALEINSR